MSHKLTLYLMMGYPGAGKTTTAKVIHELTGAVHLWADKIRRERYGRPTYSHSENIALYDHMNRLTDELLAAGNDVIFDTNFSFYKDRQYLRQIAAKLGTTTKLIWVQTPKELAKQRATYGEGHHTRILGDMAPEDFERMAHNLEHPKKDEPYIIVDGTKVSNEYIRQQLDL
jgi:predicted kinase